VALPAQCTLVVCHYIKLLCWFVMLYILWFSVNHGRNSDETVIYYTAVNKVRSTSPM